MLDDDEFTSEVTTSRMRSYIFHPPPPKVSFDQAALQDLEPKGLTYSTEPKSNHCRQILYRPVQTVNSRSFKRGTQCFQRITYWVGGVFNGTIISTTSRAGATPGIADVVHAIGLNCSGGSEAQKSDGGFEKHVEVCLFQGCVG